LICLIQTKKARINIIEPILGLPIKYPRIGEVETDTTAAREENRDIKATISQIIMDINPDNKERQSKTPKKLATPLPPRNFNQIGNICPRITNMDVKKVISGPKYSFESQTTIIALPESNIRVSAARPRFPLRNTFVAPILPEPILRMSSLPKNLVINSPNGIDPRR